LLSVPEHNSTPLRKTPGIDTPSYKSLGDLSKCINNTSMKSTEKKEDPSSSKSDDNVIVQVKNTGTSSLEATDEHIVDYGKS